MRVFSSGASLRFASGTRKRSRLPSSEYRYAVYLLHFLFLWFFSPQNAFIKSYNLIFFSERAKYQEISPKTLPNPQKKDKDRREGNGRAVVWGTRT